MVTLEHIKKMSYQEKDWLQDELWNLIATNNIKEVKNFLKDFRPKDVFCDANFDFEQEAMINAPLTLYQACIAYEKTQDWTLLEFLLSLGLQANDTDGENNVLQYYIKLGRNNPEVIHFLLQKGASFETIGQGKEASGWNIIHKCAHDQQADTLRLLAKFGADMQTRTQVYHNGELIAQTPLMIAASSTQEPMGIATKALLALGVDINASDNKQTALDVAIGVNKEILKNAGAKRYCEL